MDFCFPMYCVGCGAACSRQPAPVCPTCIRALPRADLEAVCAQMARLPETTLDLAFAMWAFTPDGPLQALQHALKYGNRPHYGRVLGGWMAPAAGAFLAGSAPELIVPIPLHHTRLLERGYNQSAFLAEGLAQGLGVPFAPELLRRTRATRSQTALGVDTRWRNVSGAFEASAGAEDQVVVVVDDVLTTGATAASAAMALRKAGARAVHLVALAHADRR